MSATDKVTILLADEDALRRDGLAAVLQGMAQHQIVAQCGDGEEALEQIRALRPQVAVVDLNLPKVHGIELVRRVRSELLATKIVILSGTANDEIVREVIRAGGDGYLLKNGPARHLVDAISYVRDGGQYFSPQLGRDGRDRHLLEETPRVAPTAATIAAPQMSPVSDDSAGQDRTLRGPRYGRSRRTVRRVDSGRLRQRIFDEAGGDNLEDREYEILDMMAEGIKPILDRLDEIDTRVEQMESGAAPVPSNVRGWLNTQLVDSLQGSGREVAVGRTTNDLEAKLPRMIEEAVTARFQQMAGKLQQEIEETHVRTLESFVKNVQVKLVQRVSALEADMSHQAEAMLQLREYSQRTEDNLSRLIAGVDKLAQELPRRLAAVQEPAGDGNAASGIKAQADRPEATVAEQVRDSRRKSGRSFVKVFWAAVAGVLVLTGWGLGLKKIMTPGASSGDTASAAGAAAPSSGRANVTPPAPGADLKTKLSAAQDYMDRKDYSMAEDIYRQVLKTEPANTDVLKLLASVLYREDKIDESAAILDRLPKELPAGAAKVADIPATAR